MDFSMLIEGSSHSPPHPPLDIIAEASSLGDRLLEITHKLNNLLNRPEISQIERDRAILEQFHFVQTTGYSANSEWATPCDTEMLSTMLKECLQMLESILDRLIKEELQPYGKQVALVSPNPSTPLGLDIIQTHCEVVLEQMQELQRVLNRLQDILHHGNHQHQREVLGETRLAFQTKLTSLFESLLTKALIVEQEPPRVMKMNTKFPHPLRLQWLVGRKLISSGEGRFLNGSPMKALIVSEAQARELFIAMAQFIPPARREFRPCGLLSSDISRPEFPKTPDGVKLCVVNYRPMQLKRIDREIRKTKGGLMVNYQQDIKSPGRNRHQRSATTPALPNPLSVTDEKFCIFFSMQIDIGGKIVVISTLSQPFVVVTHGSQEPYARATVVWDKFFSDVDRHPFDVPNSVPWSKVALMLNNRFHQATGCGLDIRQLSVLRSKLIPELSHETDDVAMVTFSRFAKEPMSDGSLVVFWEWFYGCLKLTQKHFPAYWKEAAIYGFIGRAEAEDILKGWPPGTFLLRFSNTILGGISICYVASDGVSYSVEPFTTKDLTFRSLPNTLWDLTNLSWLFPTKCNKSDAFPNHHTTPSTSVNYSVLKGLFAQQSQRVQMSNMRTVGDKGLASSSVIRSPPNLVQSGPSTSTSTGDCILANKSEYVVSYPRISIPDQYM